MQGLCSISAHLWAPEKAGVRQPILILSLFVWGSPRMQGLCSISTHLWALEKAANSDFFFLEQAISAYCRAYCFAL